MTQLPPSPYPPSGFTGLADLPGVDAPIRMTTAADVAAIVPFLLGFHPENSVVLLVFRDGRLLLTARFGIEYFDHPTILANKMAAIDQQFPNADYILAGYCADPEQADKALEMTEQLLPTGALVDSLHIGEKTFRSRHCSSPGCCPPTGTPYDAEASAAAIQAIVSGMQALPSRGGLARRVAPPRGGAALVARKRYQAALSGTVAQSDDELVERTRWLLDQGLQDPNRLDDDDLVVLAVLMARPQLRDLALRRLDQRCARAMQALWERVTQVAPCQEQAPVLGLAGMAAWVGGDGAMQVVCIERAEKSRIWHPLLQIVSDLNQMAAPPAVWEQLMVDILGDH